MSDEVCGPGLMLVGGMARSGTTMLRDICHAHPQIVMTHELRALLNTGAPFRQYYRGLRKNWWRSEHVNLINHSDNPVVATVQDATFFTRFVLSVYLKDQRNVTLANVHGALRRLFPGAAYVGDKYPRYFLELPGLVQYDGIRIVIIYRDGRDVAQSVWKRMQTDWKDAAWAHKRYSTFSKIAERWITAIDAMEEHADHVHAIRYEDLVTNPQAEFARLADYLGVDVAGFNYSSVKGTSVGKYKQGLTDAQLAEFMEVAGPTLQRLGYL